MSRIGKKEIIIPSGVELEKHPGFVLVKKQDISIEVLFPSSLEMTLEGDVCQVTRKSDDKRSRALHGLTRTLLSNAVEGLTNGYEKKLEIVGVGYRASVEDKTLKLKIGFSHDVNVVAPEGIEFEVKKNIISIKGHDKQVVGQVAANIRMLKKPEPYKGKGIKYVGEKIIRKVGKAVKGAGA